MAVEALPVAVDPVDGVEDSSRAPERMEAGKKKKPKH